MSKTAAQEFEDRITWSAGDFEFVPGTAEHNAVDNAEKTDASEPSDAPSSEVEEP